MDIFIKETGRIKTLELHDPESGRKYYDGFVEARIGLENKIHAQVEVWIAKESDYNEWHKLLQQEQTVMNMLHKHYDKFSHDTKISLTAARGLPFATGVKQTQAIISNALGQDLATINNHHLPACTP